MPERKFKVGDRVRTLEGAICGRRPVGSLGTVTAVPDEYGYAGEFSYAVLFDPIPGTEWSDNSDSWNMGDGELALVEPSDWWKVPELPAAHILETLGLEARTVVRYEIRRKNEEV